MGAMCMAASQYETRGISNALDCSNHHIVWPFGKIMDDCTVADRWEQRISAVAGVPRMERTSGESIDAASTHVSFCAAENAPSILKRTVEAYSLSFMMNRVDGDWDWGKCESGVIV